MSQFQVTPDTVLEATRPMQGISGAITDVHSQIGAHTDAAAGTSGAGALQANFADWSTALPQFAAAADHLIAAMTLSAAGYQQTDAAIAEDSAAPETGA